MTSPLRTPAHERRHDPGSVAGWPIPGAPPTRTESQHRPERVVDVMSWAPVTVSSEAPALFAAALAAKSGFSHLPVRAGDHLVGMLCTCDLRDARPRTLVAERMSVPVIATDDQETLTSAAARMTVHGIGCLPVVVGGRLYGILTRGDLRRAGLLQNDPACATCGTRHHVRARFCLDCLDAVAPAAFSELYVDLGGGD